MVGNDLISWVDLFGKAGTHFSDLGKDKNAAIDRSIANLRQAYLNLINEFDSSKYRTKNLRNAEPYFTSGIEKWREYEELGLLAIAKEPSYARQGMMQKYFGRELGILLYGVPQDKGGMRYISAYNDGSSTPKKDAYRKISWTQTKLDVKERYGDDICRVAVFHTHPGEGLHSAADQGVAKSFEISYVLRPWGDVLTWYTGLGDLQDFEGVKYPE
jgi:hypothetical protein